YKGFDYSTKFFFKNLKNSDSIYSNIYLSLKDEKPILPFSFKMDNKTVVFYIDLSDFTKFLNRFKNYDESYMIKIFNTDGLLIVDPYIKRIVVHNYNAKPSEIFTKLINNVDPFEQVTFKGIQTDTTQLGSYIKIEELGWYIVVRNEYSYILNSLSNILMLYLIAILMIILISIYFTLKITRNIFNSFDEIEMITSNIANGNYNVELKDLHYDEFNKLLKSFNKMQIEIDKREDNLESKIQQEVEKNRQKDKMIYKQSQLAAMGEMIGNIAHQWRQPLNRVNLNLAVIDDIIKRDNFDKKIVYDKIKVAQKNLLYMSDTIEDFANFFRPDKEMALFCIKDVVNKAINLIENRICKIEFKMATDSNINISGFESELLQVLLVILNNALDNFKIRETKNPKIVVELKENEYTVEIIITDNGGGIDEEYIDNIFDPYFTTKFKNEGTGIGLYMSKMIIEDSMKGSLSVYCRDINTTFKIELMR
ncbi:MAG: sensor histidine kinase, partial [Campylobacterales bacterium]|nr:sensor histidine kinase [Campylobacterales bacterium]